MFVILHCDFLCRKELTNQNVELITELHDVDIIWDTFKNMMEEDDTMAKPSIFNDKKRLYW